MKAMRVALGLIQDRGRTLVDAALVRFGPAESDFIVRHVERVRTIKEASSRALFAAESAVPGVVADLLSCSDEEFERHAQALQERLARSMGSTTSASDCVFAIVTTGTALAEQATILKLDAVVEAARTSIEEGRVNLTVLTELIPEPGRLQKALSWPDPRPNSDVVMIDTNVNAAQYFETAFDVDVSPRSIEAERQLHAAIVESVPLAEIPAVFTAAAAMSGPVDEVLGALNLTYPILEPSLADVTSGTVPTGIVRANKIAAIPLTWEADGASFSVPVNLADRVKVEPTQDGNGWKFSFTSTSKPLLRH